MDSQNCNLGLVDDRGRCGRTEHAGIGDRECSVGDIVGKKLILSRFFTEIIDLNGQFDQGLFIGIPEYRMPHILTGVRLSVGTAWLVIVAAEMLTGGIGIGFWVWDEWNNLYVPSIILAIVLIGLVGIALDVLMGLAQSRLDYTKR